MARRPNIIIFNPDQWRGDVAGYAGNRAAKTPHLDGLVSRDAVGFLRAFCQNPVCTPSRCSFMTGWYPHVRGHRTMHHMLHLERGETNVLRVLKENSYHVWWGGRNDLLSRDENPLNHCDVRARLSGSVEAPWNLGEASRWRGPKGGPDYYSFLSGKLPHSPGRERWHDHDWACIDAALEFIRGYDRSEPFCMYLPLLYPHPPYAVEEPWFSAIDRAALPPRVPAPTDWAGKPAMLKGLFERQNLSSFGEVWWSELRAVYYGMCARVDYQFGLLLDALRHSGAYDDTAVFFFSDHGDFTGDYGLVEKTQNTFEDCLTRVPFVLKPPRSLDLHPGVREQLVELVDVSATIYDMAGVDPGYSHFGRSLKNLLADPNAVHRDAVFCEGGRLPGERQAMELESIRKGEEPSDGLYWPRASLQTADDGPHHGKAVMCRTHEFKYVRRFLEQDELYDLKKDPAQTRNVIADEAYRHDLARLKDRMLTWFVETCDVVPHAADPR